MNREWIKENERRQKNMEELYDLDERDKKGHPHQGTYSGLYQEILIYEKWRKKFWSLNTYMDQVCKYVKE